MFPRRPLKGHRPLVVDRRHPLRHKHQVHGERQRAMLPWNQHQASRRYNQSHLVECSGPLEAVAPHPKSGRAKGCRVAPGEQSGRDPDKQSVLCARLQPNLPIKLCIEATLLPREALCIMRSPYVGKPHHHPMVRW